MIFKIRPNIKHQFELQHNFNIKNLIVSGCSFTYNLHDTFAVSWPYVLQDVGGFDQVLDCSMPGAGNYHISNSLQWALEIDQPDPKDSLVIVMWSGADRDDYICPSADINEHNSNFCYSKNAMTAITGGLRKESIGNTIRKEFKEFTVTKTHESRAIENYLYIVQTWNYLKNTNYKFVFLNFLDGDLPSRTKHFDIKKYLPKLARENLNSMIASIPDLYSWSLKKDLLSEDDFHPNADGYESWTKQILLPYLKTLLE
jgi:hypothetical protein